MKEKVTNLLGPLALLEWGGILLYFSFSGRIKSILHPLFHWQVLAAGALLAVAAAALFFTRNKTAVCGCEAGGNCSPQHRSVFFGNWLAPLLLLLPFGLATLLSTDACGANILRTRGVADSAAALPGLMDKFSRRPKVAVASSEPEIVEPPLPAQSDDSQASPDNPPAPSDEPVSSDDSALDYFKPNAKGNIEVSVTDLLYAAEEPALQRSLCGRPAEVTGQFMLANANNASGKRFKLLRMFMTCCAADAQPVSLLVDFSESGGLPKDVDEMVWTRAVGHIEFLMENGRQVAVLKAKSVEKTAPPEEVMLY